MFGGHTDVVAEEIQVEPAAETSGKRRDEAQK
jgi:hypothetical protein